MPGFAPPVEATSAASLRLAGPFREAVFDGWTPEQLAAVPLPPGAEPLSAVDDRLVGLPPGALVLFYELRARMHGMVMLELMGHLHLVQEHAAALFTWSVRRSATLVATLRGDRG